MAKVGIGEMVAPPEYKAPHVIGDVSLTVKQRGILHKTLKFYFALVLLESKSANYKDVMDYLGKLSQHAKKMGNLAGGGSSDFETAAHRLVCQELREKYPTHFNRLGHELADLEFKLICLQLATNHTIERLQKQHKSGGHPKDEGFRFLMLGGYGETSLSKVYKDITSNSISSSQVDQKFAQFVWDTVKTLPDWAQPKCGRHFNKTCDFDMLGTKILNTFLQTKKNITRTTPQ